MSHPSLVRRMVVDERLDVVFKSDRVGLHRRPQDSLGTGVVRGRFRVQKPVLVVAVRWVLSWRARRGSSMGARTVCVVMSVSQGQNKRGINPRNRARRHDKGERSTCTYRTDMRCIACRISMRLLFLITNRLYGAYNSSRSGQTNAILASPCSDHPRTATCGKRRKRSLCFFLHTRRRARGEPKHC